jgi:hypothetical protein
MLEELLEKLKLWDAQEARLHALEDRLYPGNTVLQLCILNCEH